MSALLTATTSEDSPDPWLRVDNAPVILMTMTSAQNLAVGAKVTTSYPRWGAHFGTVTAVQDSTSFGTVIHVRDADGRVVTYKADHVRAV